jgi:hypothetical protein
MSDAYRKPVHSLVLYGEQCVYLAAILAQWLEEGFQVDGPRVEFASVLHDQLEATLAARPL